MTSGRTDRTPPDEGGQGTEPLSWLGRLRLFVPSICVLLLVSTFMDDVAEPWEWAFVGVLVLLQVVSLAVHARSR